MTDRQVYRAICGTPPTECNSGVMPTLFTQLRHPYIWIRDRLARSLSLLWEESDSHYHEGRDICQSMVEAGWTADPHH